MADLGFDYDAPTEEPVGNFDPLPAGDYIAQVIGSEIKDTRNRTGKILALTWEIVDGASEHRQFWQNINYLNDSPKAQEIGRKQLDEVAYSAGVTRLTDTDDLHFKPCLVRLKVSPAQGDFPAKNEVATVKRIGSTAAPRQEPQRQTALDARAETPPARSESSRRPAASGDNRPWTKRA